MNKYIVSKNNDGLRIDKFILAVNKDVSRSLLYKFLRKRKVVINGKRVTNEKTIIKEGDEVKLNFYIEPKKEETKTSEKINLGDEVVYEDSAILVVNKPNNFSMHSGKKNYNERIFQYLEGKGIKIHDQAFHIHHIHRIDKNTKGLVIFAKNREAYQYIDKQFKSGDAKKEYIAVVEDRDNFLKNTLHIKEYLAYEDGRPYITKNKNEGKLSEIIIEKVGMIDNFKVLRIQNITGRKHQIRILCAHYGLPIVNDPVYGSKGYPNSMLLFSSKISLKKLSSSPLNQHTFVLNEDFINEYIDNTITKRRTRR